MLYASAVLGFLATMISCSCSNPVAADANPDPNTDSLGLSNIGEQNIVFFPENTVTLTRVVDFNISNFIMGNSNSDITITSSPGADVAIVDTNNLFDIGENTTNVILFDNFYVKQGYEYERGFVSFTQPGVDIDKFNIDNVYFLYNELNGINFKMSPDAETTNDADSNNVYEVGMVTITNVDGGHTNFNLSVKVVNMPTTVSLSTNAVSYTVDIFTSNIIEDLTEVVIVSNFENELSLGRGAYTYQLTGDDANHFSNVGNSLRTLGRFGFSNSYINGGLYNLGVRYKPEGGGTSATLAVTIQVFGGGLLWSNVSESAPWSGRSQFQAVVLTNKHVLLMGGYTTIRNDGYYLPNGRMLSDIWRSGSLSDIFVSGHDGDNWSYVSANNWSARREFQAIVLENNDILVMGGWDGSSSYVLNDIWLSSDEGVTWSDITPINNDHWSPRLNHQSAVFSDKSSGVLGLVLGGDYKTLRDV